MRTKVSENNIKIQIILPGKMHEELKEISIQKAQSVNGIIRLAIFDYLKQEAKANDK